MRNIEIKNIEQMNLKATQIRLNRLACSRYSDFDEQIISQASTLGLPLIGGTALELLGAHFNKSGFRKRSDNDLDFASNDKSVIDEFSAWLRSNVDPKKVKVDVMHILSHSLPEDHILNLGGVLVMSPEYIIWSKTRRFLEKDVTDIKWLLTIADFDKLEALIDSLGFTNKNLDNLNEIITEVSESLSDSDKSINCGCLMLGLEVPFMKELQQMIDPEDLHVFSCEDRPHCTVVYGFNVEEVPDFESLDVDLMASSVDVLITGLGFFQSDVHDVLKFNIHSAALHGLNDELTSRLSVVSTYPVYRPHSSVAYLKPGMAEKYKALVADFLITHKMPVRVSPTEWIYSTGDFR